MSSLSVNEAQNNLQQLIDQVATQGEPVIIQGEHGNAILLAEKDWSAIQETLYLLSVPEMRESIKEGLATSVEECSEDLEW
ncbi:type II toxin-antitoxin system Phd/YefM family antitoxin [Calothrix sp. UHCC 0171]|uniref:type II toxin-antitoxin system Phd/YefM family antitoxin n=1 Tax=Calothrix sp. UHCC 0171 TaxID=3110245 RepID=UPI002B1EF37B|nr:type II toxin-antitoxin system Phd/YefM family antitoxin [Calothrix sp. UHCC 0171]MEA5572656.1 type II toxin-antitoxin system Phd/YefM family antitoxin [Calothrix sp. UHCC 0171]